MTIWISHRGRCFAGTENTIEAFRFAREQGFTHFETDLRCTCDGHIILCHDRNLSRLSASPSAHKPIHEQTLSAIKAIPLHHGQAIATLSELVQEFGDAHWIFDIKTETSKQTIDIILTHWWTGQYADFFTHNVRFLFWDHGIEAYLQQQKPSATTMAQLNECKRAGVSALLGFPGLGHMQIQRTYALPATFYAIPLFKHSIVARYHRHHARVLAYLPRNPKQSQQAVGAGVDEVLTDHLPVNSQ